MISACAVIPCYNHGATAGAVAAQVLAHGVPVIIVDDGSDARSASALQSLESVRVFRLEKNSGKGAAVMHGLREAQRLGYTHALQIDADGQHATGDVPLFLAKGAARTDAVVCGEPVFDASAPKARRYGRLVSHFWVWLETRGRAQGDAMCGFRLYPLARTVALLDRVKIASGMSFDIDILVRLVWAGSPVESVRTRVGYPANGLSHFRLLRDNLRISATHARLVAGMFVPQAPARHWSRIAERGGLWGLRLISGVNRFLGRPAAQLALLPAVAWFFVTGGEARRGSRLYLERLAAHGGSAMPRPTAWNTWRHMLAFADSCLDKLEAWRGQAAAPAIEFRGAEDFDRLQRERRGALFIGSHLGNLEMIRALAVTRELASVIAVVHTENARRFAAALRHANPRFAENLLEISDFGPETAIRLSERIERGEILVIVGDRTPPSDRGRCASAPFLGHAAPFPQGPMVLAHLLACPVYLLFCVRHSHGYRIDLEAFAERVVLPPRERRAAIDAYVAQYARRLEALCCEAPLQWFNFFDFWHDPVRRS